MVRTVAPEPKRWLQHYDSANLALAPPIQNMWRELLHALDCRLIQVRFHQENDETNPKTIEMRWTIDGVVFFFVIAMVNDTNRWAYRDHNLSLGGTFGITSQDSIINAGYYTDIRGLDLKIEIRITDAAGTNQKLNAWAVYETLEVT